nr:MAG TPA: hypothetical protein [Caudoviricetes sp.]
MCTLYLHRRQLAIFKCCIVCGDNSLYFSHLDN